MSFNRLDRNGIVRLVERCRIVSDADSVFSWNNAAKIVVLETMLLSN